MVASVWKGGGKGATSYAEFFPEPSVEDVLTRAVGLINKRSDDDTYDFSDQFQVCALSDEKRFRLEPATPRKGAASGGFSLSPSLSLSHARARARALSLSLSLSLSHTHTHRLKSWSRAGKMTDAASIACMPTEARAAGAGTTRAPAAAPLLASIRRCL